MHQTSAVDSRPEIRIGGTKDDSKVEACRKSLKDLGEGPISHGLRVNDMEVVNWRCCGSALFHSSSGTGLVDGDTNRDLKR